MRGRLFVVHLRGNQRADEADDDVLTDGPMLLEILVAVSRGVHQHEARRLLGAVRTDGFTQPSGGLGHEPARLPPDPLEADVVPEAGRDRAAARRVLRQRGVVQVEQAGFGDLQPGMVPHRLGERRSVADDHPHGETAPQKLANQQAPRGASGADDQDRLHFVLLIHFNPCCAPGV